MKPLRMEVVLPQDWQDAIESAANKAGLNKSEFVRAAILNALPKQAAKGLSEPRPRARPRKKV